MVTGCGSGATKTVTVVEVQHHAKAAALEVPHSGKPSRCTVWLMGGSALVTFQGDGYPVASRRLLGHEVESQGGQISHAVANGKVLTIVQMRTGQLSYWPWDAVSYKQAEREYKRALAGE